MNFMEVIAEKWQAMRRKVEPALTAMGSFFAKAGKVLALIWSYIVKFRKVCLAIPVAWASVRLAFQNLERLPETVGLDLQVDGTFAIQMSREWACWLPVILTLVCLLLMLCSKRVLTPWVVSVLTLIVPIFIWVINVFPS